MDRRDRHRSTTVATMRVAAILAGPVASAGFLLRWLVTGAVVGLVAGVSSFVFLEGLDLATDTRIGNSWLIWFLPLAGGAIGAAYHHLGGRAAQGTALVLDEIHQPDLGVPGRMAPMVLVGTWLTHLLGGSVGREGTALQLSASLSDTLARPLRLTPDGRRLLLVTAIAGGFGAVFGVPAAGAVFALEVQSIGRVRYEALVPALTASVIGHLTVGGLGHHHPLRPRPDVGLDAGLVLRVALAGLAFGACAALFVEATHRVKAVLAARVGYPPLRLVAGAVGVLGLTALFGTDYLGLSLPLIDRGLAGEPLPFAVFALKILFTVVTLGAGFPGGEVTPLFVIGTTLGAAMAGPLGLDVTLLAAIGFVAVFAGAANTPLACTIMGVELFGGGAVVPLTVACTAAYITSGHRGIYVSQRIHAPKGVVAFEGRPALRDLDRPHRRWRPSGGGAGLEGLVEEEPGEGEEGDGGADPDRPLR